MLNPAGSFINVTTSIAIFSEFDLDHVERQWKTEYREDGKAFDGFLAEKSGKWKRGEDSHPRTRGFSWLSRVPMHDFRTRRILSTWTSKRYRPIHRAGGTPAKPGFDEGQQEPRRLTSAVPRFGNRFLAGNRQARSMSARVVSSAPAERVAFY
jgi:hypothetical protein